MKKDYPPRVFGFPLWYGKIKGRIAKKYLWHSIFRNRKFLSMVASLGPGDFIHDCSAFNVRVAKINPMYRQVGKGFVLVDIDIENDKGGGCSFTHCGVESAWPRESIVAYWEGAAKYWKEQNDPWNFAKRFEFTTIDEFGQAIFDEKGFKAKYPNIT